MAQASVLVVLLCCLCRLAIANSPVCSFVDAAVVTTANTTAGLGEALVVAGGALDPTGSGPLEVLFQLEEPAPQDTVADSVNMVAFLVFQASRKLVKLTFDACSTPAFSTMLVQRFVTALDVNTVGMLVFFSENSVDGDTVYSMPYTMTSQDDIVKLFSLPSGWVVKVAGLAYHAQSGCIFASAWRKTSGASQQDTVFMWCDGFDSPVTLPNCTACEALSFAGVAGLRIDQVTGMLYLLVLSNPNTLYSYNILAKAGPLPYLPDLPDVGPGFDLHSGSRMFYFGGAAANGNAIFRISYGGDHLQLLTPAAAFDVPLVSVSAGFINCPPSALNRTH